MNVWSQFTAPHQNKVIPNIQRFWRPTQFSYQPGTLVSQLASLQPGDFVKLIDYVPGSAQVYRHDGNGSLGILDWNPACFWDETTQQLITAGARRKTKLVAFSDITGRWREISQPETAYIGTAHWYGNTAFSGSIAMLNRWTYDPVTSEWVDFRAATGFTFSNTGSLAWWPEYGTKGAWFNADDGKFKLYDIATQAVVMLAASSHGRHATVIRHPMTGKLLVCGGTNTAAVVTLVDIDGSHHRVADAPSNYAMSSLPLFFHPAQNVYLRSSSAEGDGHLLSYWPDQDRWQDEGDYPGRAKWQYDTYCEGPGGVLLTHRPAGIYAYKPPMLVLT